MEYLDGQPLSELIVRGREGGGFPLGMQLAVLVDALAGLHAAHELQDFDGTPLGVVHRDISPHNLFVTVEGQSKVLDFGIAKLARSLVETEVGTTKGKLRYMAPEQVACGKLDRRADVYAAGVILWEALAGERMWKGLDEVEIRRRVRAGELPPPRLGRAWASEALLAICGRALSLAPGDRHPTALALAEELESALGALPGGAPSRREIGAAVARLHADERTNTRALIEAEIARMDGAAALRRSPARRRRPDRRPAPTVARRRRPLGRLSWRRPPPSKRSTRSRAPPSPRPAGRCANRRPRRHPPSRPPRRVRRRTVPIRSSSTTTGSRSFGPSACERWAGDA
jgi:serine/threonine-protein kinase